MNTLIKRSAFLFLLLSYSCSPYSNLLRKVGGARGWYQNPSWSPAGDQIIFQFRSYESDEEQFIVINSDGSDWRTLDIPPEKILAASMPQWFDRHIILYIQSSVNPRTNNISSQLALYDITNGTEEVRNSGSSINSISSTSSDDNYRIAIARRIKKGHDSLIIYDYQKDSSTEVYRTPENALIEDVAWNAQGTEVTYTVSYHSKDSSQPITVALEVINVLSGERKVILGPTDKPLFSSPTWSPDGRWIALRATDKEAGYLSYLLLISANGDKQQRIDLPDSVTPTYVRWSPSNNRLVIASLGRPGLNYLYVFDISSWLTSTDSR